MEPDIHKEENRLRQEFYFSGENVSDKKTESSFSLLHHPLQIKKRANCAWVYPTRCSVVTMYSTPHLVVDKLREVCAIHFGRIDTTICSDPASRRHYIMWLTDAPTCEPRANSESDSLRSLKKKLPIHAALR
jgi:hypothetical protein